MEVCFHDGFLTLYSAPEKATSWVFSSLLRFCSGRAASCQEQLCPGPSCRLSTSSFSFFQTLSTFRAWSCAENIPDMWRAPRIQWACSALPPAGKRKLVHIRVIPGIVGVSAQWTRSGLWAARARLCPRKWASGFPSLLLSYVEERPVKTSETIFKCSIEDPGRIPSAHEPLKGFLQVRFCVRLFFFFSFYFGLTRGRASVFVKFKRRARSCSALVDFGNVLFRGESKELVFCASPINAIYEDGPVELPVLGQDEQQHRDSVLWR